jgi:hypothetical protein
LKREFTLTTEFSDGGFNNIFRLDRKLFDYMDKLIGSDILAEECNPSETYRTRNVHRAKQCCCFCVTIVAKATQQ